MKKLTGGNFVEWLLILVAISVVIFVLVVPGVFRGSLFGFSPFTNSSSTSAVGPTVSGTGAKQASGTKATTGTKLSGVKTTSTVVASSLSLGTGNAAYTYQPSEEYITIQNGGGSSVDLTGYKLENGKSSRAYAVGNNEVYYPSDSALIPQGAYIVAASGQSPLSDIVLKPGETAVVMSGSPGNISPYQLVSFKENKCTGYFAESYRFPSGLARSCPAPSKESGVQGLDIACQDYLAGMRSCHKPVFKDDAKLGPTVDDSAGLSGACIAFIKARMNYPACLDYHAGDNNFQGSTWYVYLSKPWEMWATSHEIISLYDREGRLVAKTSY
ncbi:lamin tail domain-containing protein [Candidatus Parcubacteria bacterium]|nr:lamin tail domain-containing protein [Candidatus Parcubacteria bacterium]